MYPSRLSCQLLSVFLGILLVGVPVRPDPAALLGVAKASGPVEINGMPFPDESNVYSGDQISTGKEATLTLVASWQERAQLAPESRARVRKHGESIVIALEEGTVYFRSKGATRTVLENYGVEVRAHKKIPTIAQVTLLSPQKARVAAVRGSVAVNAPAQSVVLRPGQAALITAALDQRLPGAGGGAGPSQGAVIAITIAVIAGIVTAIAVPLALQGEEKVSPSGP